MCQRPVQNLQSNGTRLIFVDSLTNMEGDDRKLRLHTLTAMRSPRHSFILFPATAQLDRSTDPQIKGSILFMSSSRHATLLRIRIGFSSYKLQNETEMLKNRGDPGYGM